MVRGERLAFGVLPLLGGNKLIVIVIVLIDVLINVFFFLCSLVNEPWRLGCVLKLFAKL